MQTHAKPRVPGNSVPVSPWTLPPLALGWCTALRYKADFGTNIHTFLHAHFRAGHRAACAVPLAWQKKCACITQTSQTQCLQQPWQNLSLLLSASPAKQPGGPHGQERLQHWVQQQLCDLFGFQGTRNMGFVAQISPKYRGIKKPLSLLHFSSI